MQIEMKKRIRGRGETLAFFPESDVGNPSAKWDGKIRNQKKLQRSKDKVQIYELNIKLKDILTEKSSFLLKGATYAPSFSSQTRSLQHVCDCVAGTEHVAPTL